MMSTATTMVARMKSQGGDVGQGSQFCPTWKYRGSVSWHAAQPSPVAPGAHAPPTQREGNGHAVQVCVVLR